MIEDTQRPPRLWPSAWLLVKSLFGIFRWYVPHVGLGLTHCKCFVSLDIPLNSRSSHSPGQSCLTHPVQSSFLLSSHLSLMMHHDWAGNPKPTRFFLFAIILLLSHQLENKNNSWSNVPRYDRGSRLHTELLQTTCELHGMEWGKKGLLWNRALKRDLLQRPGNSNRVSDLQWAKPCLYLWFTCSTLGAGWDAGFHIT